MPITNTSDAILEVKRALAENDLDTVSAYADNKPRYSPTLYD